METSNSRLFNQLFGYSMIIAPLFFAASTFFWEDGRYGVTGGTLVSLAAPFWVLAFFGIFGALQQKMPVYSAIGLLVALFGVISGVGFGFADAFSEAFNVSHEKFLEGIWQYPTAFGLLLFWTGPLFPLSILVLGIQLIRSKSAPIWVGLMMVLAGIAFPLSRIPRVDWMAHLADLLLLIPFSFLGWKFLRRQAIV